MATMALAVNLIKYFTVVMHIDLADTANQLTNFMGASYILSILVAVLANTYIGRFKAGLISGFIEFLVRYSANHWKYHHGNDDPTILTRLTSCSCLLTEISFL